MTPVCSKLIFRRLLIKLATEFTFKVNNRLLKQVDDCTMKTTVTFSDIYVVKMENGVVIPFKPIFYRKPIHVLLLVPDNDSQFAIGT